VILSGDSDISVELMRDNNIRINTAETFTFPYLNTKLTVSHHIKFVDRTEQISRFKTQKKSLQKLINCKSRHMTQGFNSFEK